MEKYIKNLSIAFIILTTMFFFNMIGLANAEQVGVPEFVLKILVVGANALLFLVPILYMVIFAISMVLFYKRIINMQNRMVNTKFDKFPILWFVLASMGFVGYFVFVSSIFG